MKKGKEKNSEKGSKEVVNNFSKRNKSNKKTKYSRFLHSVFNLLCCFGRFFTLGKCFESEAFKKAKGQGPMLVMCNHASSLDFIYFIPPLRGIKLNFVVAENMLYSNGLLAYLIKKTGVITKKQYVADIGTVKSIKRNVDSGISVLLCPEGKVSPDGTCGVLSESSGKLIKFINCPVAVIKTEGASLAYPKWGTNRRWGKIITRCDMLYSKEDVKQLSVEELNEGLAKALEYNEHEFQQNGGLRYLGLRRTVGLDKVLFRCPKCGNKYAIISKNRLLKCKICNNEILYKSSGELKPVNSYSTAPNRIDRWFELERKLARREAECDDFSITKEVALFIGDDKNHRFKFIAIGFLTLGKDEVVFNANMDVRPVKVKQKFGMHGFKYALNVKGKYESVERTFKKITFNIQNYQSIAFMPGTSLELYDNRYTYRFAFTRDLAATEYALLIEELYKIRRSEQMSVN